MTTSDRRVGAGLSILCFVALAGLGHHTWGTIDAIQRFAVTRAFFATGSVVTPEFGPVKYGPLPSALMLPTYALGWAAGAVTGSAEPDRIAYRVTAFVFTPLVVSLLIGLWYGVARRWGHAPAASAAGAWTLLWGTLVLPYSRLLFSELLSATLLFAAAACLLVPAGETPRRAGFVLLGAAALNVLVFFPLLLVAGVAVPVREWRRGRQQSARRTALVAASTVLVTGACWVLYDIARYGNAAHPGYEGEGFTTPLVRGLYGLLASPGRGLVFYSLPTALAAFLCLRGAVTPGSAARARDGVAIAVFLFYLVLYALWYSFEGGWCWGPRFLLPFVPLLHLGLLSLWSRGRLAGAAALAAGFLVNAWEYATEWQAWEEATFASGLIDYQKSVFDPRFVPALHGFAGATSAARGLQFAAVAVLTSYGVFRVVRRAERDFRRGAEAS